MQAYQDVPLRSCCEQAGGSSCQHGRLARFQSQFGLNHTSLAQDLCNAATRKRKSFATLPAGGMLRMRKERRDAKGGVMVTTQRLNLVAMGAAFALVGAVVLGLI